MRICGSGQRMRETDRDEPVRTPDRIQLDENAAFELIGGRKGPHRLAGCARAHGAHGEERERAQSHKREDPTSHMQAIGRSTPTPDH